MNKMPLVTIAITTYNRPKELKIALESAINQTYKNIEILVSDNCSENPQVEKLCREYASEDTRIKYFRHDKNRGIGWNSQFVIDIATGEYYLGACDDDWLSENFVEEALNAMISNKDCAMIYGATHLYDSDYNVIEKTCFHDIDNENYADRLPIYLENAMPYRLATCFLKTEAIQSIKEYGKNRFCEDQIVMAKMLFLGKFKILPNICYHKLNNGNTKDLETLKSHFNMPKLTGENLFETVVMTVIDAVLEDEFFAERMERSQINEVVANLHQKLILDKKEPQKVEGFFKRLKTQRKKIKKEKVHKTLVTGKNTLLLDSLTVRNPYNNKITIGADCMLNCNFIFESDTGEIEIGNRVFINGGTDIISRSKIKFGNDITVAWGCTFYDHNSHSLDWKERSNDLVRQIMDYKNTGDFIKNKKWDIVKSSPITICDKVWIGFDCTILNGVTVGEGAIIGAKSVVREDVEPWTVVAGNPARVIKKIKHD